MSPVQIASLMVVASGALHACVNAILKSGQDKMSSRALIDGFSALLVLPVAFVVPLPHGAWGWLAGGADRKEHRTASARARLSLPYGVFRRILSAP